MSEKPGVVIPVDNDIISELRQEIIRLTQENKRLRELVYFQAVDDIPQIPAILKRQAT